jgi:hypothetical protein
MILTEARMLTLAVLLVAGVFTMSVSAQDPAGEETPPSPPPTLEQLAGSADFIALVQVLDTDYEYAREFPVGGTAFLRVLIPYKLDRPLPDIVEVYEEGLHAGECYFPNPPLTEEGRRYLLFARRNPDVEGQYLGLATGCALTVLVTAENRYTLRYPAEGLDFSDDLAALARPTLFADAHAVLDYEELDVAERNDLLERGLLEPLEDRTYRLTQGVPLSEVRGLLGDDNLTRDRTLLRPATVEETP